MIGFFKRQRPTDAELKAEAETYIRTVSEQMRTRLGQAHEEIVRDARIVDIGHKLDAIAEHLGVEFKPATCDCKKHGYVAEKKGKPEETRTYTFKADYDVRVDTDRKVDFTKMSPEQEKERNAVIQEMLDLMDPDAIAELIIAGSLAEYVGKVSIPTDKIGMAIAAVASRVMREWGGYTEETTPPTQENDNDSSRKNPDHLRE